MLIFFQHLTMHLLKYFVEEEQIAAFISIGTSEKPCGSAILQHHWKGSSLQSSEIQDPWFPGSQDKCGSRWAVVGRNIRDDTPVPLPCQNRTKWAWKCVVLHTGTWHFQLIWAGSIGTSGGLSCKSFLCMWISLAKIFAWAEGWSEIGKYSWKVFLEPQ